MSTAVLNPKYLPLIQKPLCCAVTCLQMILFRNGCGLHDQEDLAVKFGVRISPENALAFRDDMPVLTRTNFDEGIPTVESEDKINSFLKEAGYPLKAKAWKFSEIEDTSSFLLDNIKRNNDIWIEYHSQEIHSYDRSGGDYIHDGLVESLDAVGRTAVVIDPMPEHRQRLNVTLNQIENGISEKFGRETGFVIVENAR